MTYEISINRLAAPGARQQLRITPDEGARIVDELAATHGLCVVSREGLRTDVAPGPDTDVAAFIEDARSCGAFVQPMSSRGQTSLFSMSVWYTQQRSFYGDSLELSAGLKVGDPHALSGTAYRKIMRALSANKTTVMLDLGELDDAEAADVLLGVRTLLHKLPHEDRCRVVWFKLIRHPSGQCHIKANLSRKRI